MSDFKAKMLNKCASSGAHVIVPDMEDSVPLDKKEQARQMVTENLPKIREALGAKGQLFPRVNALDSGLM